MVRRLVVLYLCFCSPGFSSSTGGSGKTTVGSAAVTPLPHVAEPEAPKKISTAHARQPASTATLRAPRPAIVLPLGVSMQSGSGHSVIAASLPAYYYTGNYYLAPWGIDPPTNTSCSFQNPCQTITGIQGKVSSTAPVVLLRGGIYPPPTSATSTAVSLTVAGASGSPIVYAAYPGETPIITGALPITGWQPATGSGQCATGTSSTCYKATLPATITANFEYLIYVPGGWPPSYLPYVMGRRNQSVSTPTGYLFNANASGSSCAGSSTCINVNATDISVLCNGSASNCTGSGPPLHNPTDVKLYNFNLSTVDVFRVSSVNGTTSPPVINFSGTPGGCPLIRRK